MATQARPREHPCARFCGTRAIRIRRGEYAGHPRLRRALRVAPEIKRDRTLKSVSGSADHKRVARASKRSRARERGDRKVPWLALDAWTLYFLCLSTPPVRDESGPHRCHALVVGTSTNAFKD